MPTYSEHAAALISHLSLRAPPVAILFCSEPPAGVRRIDSAALAGCGYWKLAAAGQVFYTEAADHLGCAVGAYTHGAELGPTQKVELERMLTMMTSVQYIAMEEVPGIPVRQGKLSFVVYAPLASAPDRPDLVLVRSNPRASMLLSEATHAAGARGATAPVMRPACAMLPQVLSSGHSTTSLGCMGNRVYTGLPDDEMWHALPGARLDAIMEKVSIIVEANQAIRAFHEARLAESVG
jgi:uncharacterized protein (DUF169 family)